MPLNHLIALISNARQYRDVRARLQYTLPEIDLTRLFEINPAAVRSGTLVLANGLG